MNIDKPKTFRKLSFASKPKVMIVEARFYNDIGDMLLDGAKEVLAMHEAEYEIFTVPGALEIPAAVEFGVQSKRFNAYLALGCVIRGGTSHYEIVSGESCRGLMDLSIRHGLCLGNGILTVENMGQAIERADPSQMNKGGGAAQAALEMLAIKQSLLG
jgi:6,7-dimethyl-8-ribityllumazine synthase